MHPCFFRLFSKTNIALQSDLELLIDVQEQIHSFLNPTNLTAKKNFTQLLFIKSKGDLALQAFYLNHSSKFAEFVFAASFSYLLPCQHLLIVLFARRNISYFLSHMKVSKNTFFPIFSSFFAECELVLSLLKGGRRSFSNSNGRLKGGVSVEHLVPKMVVEKLLMELDEEMTKLELAIQKRVSETICQSEEEFSENLESANQHLFELQQFIQDEKNREDENSIAHASYRLSY